MAAGARPAADRGEIAGGRVRTGRAGAGASRPAALPLPPVQLPWSSVMSSQVTMIVSLMSGLPLCPVESPAFPFW